MLLAAQLTKLRDRVAQQERSDGTAYVYDKDSQRIFSLHVKDGVSPTSGRHLQHVFDGLLTPASLRTWRPSLSVSTRAAAARSSVGRSPRPPLRKMTDR